MLRSNVVAAGTVALWAAFVVSPLWSQSFPASVDLSALDGTSGFIITGIDSNDYSGRSVSGIGDVNADGKEDVLIGAYLANPNGESGESYVVFGGYDIGLDTPLNLSTLDGSSGFVINGVGDGDRSGFSVSGAGDINSDSIPDLVIGAFESGSRGQAYVIFGNSLLGTDIASDGVLELTSLDGSNGFVMNGPDSSSRVGWSVSDAGDVNDDGVADVIVGARSAAGESYVVFGGPDVGSNGEIELSTLDGVSGFIINGINSGSGYDVSDAGDVNDDGVSDLIIGARDNIGAGTSYVVFGRSSIGSSGIFDLADLVNSDGSSGFIIRGVDAFDRSGTSVSGVGDINGDGISDIVVGAYQADPFGINLAGESYIVFGGSTISTQGSVPGELDLATLNGSSGFTINGIDQRDWSGYSVSSAGDMNGDGIGDLIIGAPGDNIVTHDASGESYVIFGDIGIGANGAFNLSSLNGSNGFVINGIASKDMAGISVSGAGDVNGDGIDDVIIGAPQATNTSGMNNAGESYIVFGRSTVTCNGLLITVDLSQGQSPGPGNDVILGTPGNDDIRGRAGDDTICGMGGDDFIHGNSGDDWIDGGDGVDNIRGGQGADTLFSGNGATVGTASRVFGGNGDDTIFGGLDADDLRGGRGEDMISGEQGADLIIGNDNDDTLFGGLGDDVIRGGGGANDGLFGEDGADSLDGGSGGNDFCDGGGQGVDTDTNCEVF